MSDFSTLCPLFNTGVYSELTIPGPFSTASASTTTKFAGIIFGRSVIVTAGYLAKMTALASATAKCKISLSRATSWASASQTIFATLTISKTVTTQILKKYIAMTQAVAKTFSATQWLLVKSETASKPTGKSITGIIVRYKEK